MTHLQRFSKCLQLDKRDNSMVLPIIFFFCLAWSIWLSFTPIELSGQYTAWGVQWSCITAVWSQHPFQCTFATIGIFVSWIMIEWKPLPRYTPSQPCPTSRDSTQTQRTKDGI